MTAAYYDLPTNVASGALGLIFGFLGGTTMRLRLERLHVTWQDVVRVATGLVILLLVLASVIASFQASSRLATIAACQHDANQAFATGLSQRGDANHQANAAAEADAAAQLSFLTAITKPGVTTAQGKAAYEDYLKALSTYQGALQKLDAAQAANPLTVKDCGS